jgi:hypothetical protein
MSQTDPARIKTSQIPLGTVLSFTYCRFLLMMQRSTKSTILVSILKSLGRFYRNFCNRIEMLNRYIPYLPGLVDSPKGANMKRAEALTGPELAQLLLRLVPQHHQDQYELIKGIIPVNLRLMLNTLVTIEKMDIQVPKKAEKASKSENGKCKRKGALTDNKVSNKKSRFSKHCELCKKHTHNTVDCKRYKKDGTQKKTFQSKKGIASKKSDRRSFKTMEDTLKKTMKTEFKKMKKDNNKLKKRNRNDSSEEFNSS